MILVRSRYALVIPTKDRTFTAATVLVLVRLLVLLLYARSRTRITLYKVPNTKCAIVVAQNVFMECWRKTQV